MEGEEPEGKVSRAALPTLERYVCPRGEQRWRHSCRTLAAAAAQTRGLSSECLSKMPPTPDGAHQASDDEPLPYEPDYVLNFEFDSTESYVEFCVDGF